MGSAYIKPPRTILEAFQSLPEGTLAQLINNQIVMSPAPTNTHQKVLGKIFSQLLQFADENNLGEVRVAPFDVYFNRRNVYQPDIVFIAHANLHHLKESGFYGAPDLVIEVLSPGTWRADKEDKKDEYERSGVKEYWMVDPATKIAEGYLLREGVFEPAESTTDMLQINLLQLVINF